MITAAEAAAATQLARTIRVDEEIQRIHAAIDDSIKEGSASVQVKTTLEPEHLAADVVAFLKGLGYSVEYTVATSGYGGSSAAYYHIKW